MQIALQRRPWLILAGCFITLALFLHVFVQSSPFRRRSTIPSAQHLLRVHGNATRPAPENACQRPGGSTLDYPRAANELQNVTYPVPTLGSFDALGIEQTWMTIDQRYGPYGYGEDRSTYEFPRVDWKAVNWGELQSACYKANEASFEVPPPDLSVPRFNTQAPQAPSVKSERQAIVLRTWSTYEYHPEDYWNIRSLISEAALETGAQYQVILLVDVKGDENEQIHTNETAYTEMLDQAVPPEFRNMAVLFHESLQHKWYERVGEYKPIFQIMQPLQLFAHFYPEFDHYWQFEMDTRFFGHVGKMLRAFHDFGQAQPTKQSSERASWAYMPHAHGSYEDFKHNVDKGLKGGATIWGPVEMKGVTPIGPEPPVQDPKDDNLEWGVGQDADLLIFGPLNDVRRFRAGDDWVFKGHGGFADDAPRWMAVPAQARASYDLLEAIHRAQHETGLQIASEATLPSFTLWHGLKLVGLPLPKFQVPERDIWELNFVKNGGLPSQTPDGVADGPGTYRGGSFAFFSRSMTFDWWSSLCDPVFDFWMKVPYDKPKPNHEHVEYINIPNELPWFMREVDGQVYAPNIMMHPHKSNTYRAPE